MTAWDDDIVIDFEGHDYFVEQVGPKVWVTVDGGDSVTVFESPYAAERRGVTKLLQESGLVIKAAFIANGGTL